MFRTEEGERRWAVLVVPLILCGSPLLAILLNRSLPGWGFISFEFRNLLFLLLVPFVFGVVSETPPVVIGEREARDGTIVFAGFLLIGWFLMLLNGWVLDVWVNVLPLVLFFSQVVGFHAGRWVGRIPRHKLPNEPADG